MIMINDRFHIDRHVFFVKKGNYDDVIFEIILIKFDTETKDLRHKRLNSVKLTKCNVITFVIIFITLYNT